MAFCHEVRTVCLTMIKKHPGMDRIHLAKRIKREYPALVKAGPSLYRAKSGQVYFYDLTAAVRRQVKHLIATKKVEVALIPQGKYSPKIGLLPIA